MSVICLHCCYFVGWLSERVIQAVKADASAVCRGFFWLICVRVDLVVGRWTGDKRLWMDGTAA